MNPIFRFFIMIGAHYAAYLGYLRRGDPVGASLLAIAPSSELLEFMVYFLAHKVFEKREADAGGKSQPRGYGSCQLILEEILRKRSKYVVVDYQGTDKFYRTPVLVLWERYAKSLLCEISEQELQARAKLAFESVNARPGDDAEVEIYPRVDIARHESRRLRVVITRG
jgi:hypothetical protein